MAQDTALKINAATTDDIKLPDGGAFISNASFIRSGLDLYMVAPDGQTVVLEGYFTHTPAPNIMTIDGGKLTSAMVEAFLPPQYAGQYAEAMQTATDASPAGKITDISGDAVIVRADGTRVPATTGTLIYAGDVIETSADGAVNILFADNTTFAISESARLSVDDFTFNAETESGSSFFSLLQGMFVYTSGLIGKNDPASVGIETPVGSIGIRGTVVAGHISPAGEESQITIIDGAIVVTNASGVTEMNDHFGTISLSGHDSAPVNLGKMSFDAFMQSFQSLAPVAGGTLRGVSQFAPEGEQAPETQPEDAPSQHLELDPSVLPPQPGTNFGEAPGTSPLESPATPLRPGVQTAGSSATADTNDIVVSNIPAPPLPPPATIAFAFAGWYVNAGMGLSPLLIGDNGTRVIGTLSTANLPAGATISVTGDFAVDYLEYIAGGNPFDMQGATPGTPSENPFEFDSATGQLLLKNTTAVFPDINPGPFHFDITVTNSSGTTIFTQAIDLNYTDLALFEPGALVFRGDINGTPTNDSAVGGGTDMIGGIGADDIMFGGGGNDFISGKGGQDTLIGGAGDDKIMVSNASFIHVDGGVGNDTLVLGDTSTTDTTFNFTTMAGTVRNIETLELGTGSALAGHDVILRIEDIFSMAKDNDSGTNTLTITASSISSTGVSTVTIADASGTGFRDGGGSLLVNSGTLGTGDVELRGTYNGETVTLIIQQDAINGNLVTVS